MCVCSEQETEPAAALVLVKVSDWFVDHRMRDEVMISGDVRAGDAAEQ